MVGVSMKVGIPSVSEWSGKQVEGDTSCQRHCINVRRYSKRERQTISQGHALRLVACIPIVTVDQGHNVWDRQVTHPRRPLSEVTELA